jgi:hypothetical protein
MVVDMTTVKQEKGLEEELNELSKNMDATIYSFNLLCNRFEQDKDIMLKDGLKIREVVLELRNELASFAKMKGELNELLASSLKVAANTVVHKTNERVQEALNETLGRASNKLNEALHRTESKLDYLQSLDKKRLIWMAIGLVVLLIIAGVLAAKLYMVDPIMRFNKATCEVYKQRCLLVK